LVEQGNRYRAQLRAGQGAARRARHRLYPDSPGSTALDTQQRAAVLLLHDRMIETVLFDVMRPMLFRHAVPYRSSGACVVGRALETANRERHALSADEIDYLTTNFTALGRNPDVERCSRGPILNIAGTRQCDWVIDDD
jgi:hypothetical protein